MILDCPLTIVNSSVAGDVVSFTLVYVLVSIIILFVVGKIAWYLIEKGVF